MKVYVAGSSAEPERAVRWSTALREAGITVVLTWPETVAQVGSANPTGVGAEQRRAWAYQDLVVELGEADWLWFLVPPPTAPTRGAWVELGYAFAERRHIICSGATAQSVFCALGLERTTDAEAFDVLVRAYVPATRS